MANDGQQKLLRVVETYKPTNLEDEVDPTTGQVRMFAKEPQIEQMFDFFNEKLGGVQTENKELRHELQATNQQITRVGNSLSKLVSKFEEMVVTNQNPELMVSPHEPGHEDVALVDSPLPTESAYRCTTGDLAGYVGIQASRLGLFLRLSSIKGDYRYHCAIKAGAKSTLNLYKPRALKGLYEFVSINKPQWIKQHEVEALKHYLIAHELI